MSESYLESLRRQHQEIHSEIDRLQGQLSVPNEVLAKKKKRKLLLKDRIHHIEHMVPAE